MRFGYRAYAGPATGIVLKEQATKKSRSTRNLLLIVIVGKKTIPGWPSSSF